MFFYSSLIDSYQADRAVRVDVAVVDAGLEGDLVWWCRGGCERKERVREGRVARR